MVSLGEKAKSRQTVVVVVQDIFKMLGGVCEYE